MSGALTSLNDDSMKVSSVHLSCISAMYSAVQVENGHRWQYTQAILLPLHTEGAYLLCLLFQELQNLLPDLRGKWHKLQPQTVQALQADTSAVASKLMQLKVWFPKANVSIMVAKW